NPSEEPWIAVIALGDRGTADKERQEKCNCEAGMGGLGPETRQHGANGHALLPFMARANAYARRNREPFAASKRSSLAAPANESMRQGATRSMRPISDRRAIRSDPALFRTWRGPFFACLTESRPKARFRRRR